MSKWEGSFQNRIMEGKTIVNKIEVGTGVTEMCYSDREPYEVVEVIDDKHLLIRKCNATLIEGNCCSEHQVYKYDLEPYEETFITKEFLEDKDRMLRMQIFNPKMYKRIMEGKIGDKIWDNNIKIVLTKNGWRERTSTGKLGTTKYTIGIKEKYVDPCF